MKQETVDAIISKVVSSSVLKINWDERGLAPIGFAKGMAICYGMVYEGLLLGDSISKVMVAVVEGRHDVFDYYNEQFEDVGMPNIGMPDADRLRHLFVFLYGLAARESSFGYDIGQDASAPGNRTSVRAEAGWFQQSWDSLLANPIELKKLLDFYTKNPIDPMLPIFREGVTPRPGAMTNYGSGDGVTFQRLAKTCPTFSVKAAGIAIRTMCNAWGPINNHAVELRSAVDTLFKDVQVIVDAEYVGTSGKPEQQSLSWYMRLMDTVLSMFRRTPKVTPKLPDLPPASKQVPPWMPIAIKEIGFHERGENFGIEKYVEGGKTGGTTGEPWCADFANYCLETAGVPGTRSAMARSFEKSSKFIKLSGPAYGAITTMWRGSPSSGSGHVFFYDGENDSGILGLGGNQKDSVCKQINPRDRVVGYYWPKDYPVPIIGKIAVIGVGASSGSES